MALRFLLFIAAWVPATHCWGKIAVAVDVLAEHSLIERRLSAPEPLASQIGKLHAVIRVRPRLMINKRWAVEVPVGASLSSNTDGGQIVRSTITADAVRTLSRRTSLLLGTGLLIHTFVSQGGEVRLRNGESTSTFYLPSGVTSAAMIALHLGFEWLFVKRLTWGTHVYGIALGDRLRRSVTVSSGIGVFF